MLRYMLYTRTQRQRPSTLEAYTRTPPTCCSMHHLRRGPILYLVTALTAAATTPPHVPPRSTSAGAANGGPASPSRRVAGLHSRTTERAAALFRRTAGGHQRGVARRAHSWLAVGGHLVESGAKSHAHCVLCCAVRYRLRQCGAPKYVPRARVDFRPARPHWRRATRPAAGQISTQIFLGLYLKPETIPPTTMR